MIFHLIEVYVPRTFQTEVHVAMAPLALFEGSGYKLSKTGVAFCR